MDPAGLGRELIDDGGDLVVRALLLAYGIAVFAVARAQVVAPA